ncbi:MAG: hypothetical protein V2I43_21000, partial [Parvularcula sp.]|nr:hypothetical protein [Parvularcula sp.]
RCGSVSVVSSCSLLAHGIMPISRRASTHQGRADDRSHLSLAISRFVQQSSLFPSVAKTCKPFPPEECQDYFEAVGYVAGLSCTNRVWDSFDESSVVAGMHEQTDTAGLQDQELASPR